MKLTRHGAQRLHERTLMEASEVLKIISTGAVVSLGKHRTYEYLVFFSPRDFDVKIAIVADNRRTLISIWHRTYALPEAVKPLTSLVAREARRLHRSYFFTHLVESPATQILHTFIVRIDVVVEGKTEYRHKSRIQVLGTTPTPDEWSMIRSEATQIAEIVDLHKDDIIGEKRLRYDVNLIGIDIREHLLLKVYKHKELLQE